MLFRPRALLAAAIMVLPFAAGSFLSALIAELLHESREREAVPVGQLLLLIAVVAILQGLTAVLARYLWRSSADWKLFGMAKRNWLGFLCMSYIMGLLAVCVFPPGG
jgi:hypothetical protein